LLSSTERVTAGLSKGIDLGAPAVSAVSPARDGLAFLGNGLVGMGGEDRLGSSLHKFTLIL